MKFDVVDFYPSISKELLTKSIQFARKYIDVSNDQVEIIFHSCKTILFFNNECWIKKNSAHDLFDIPMGSFHGAEVCELVGLFILNEIINDKKIEKSNCGLYRDDGLLIVKKRSPRFIEQLRKSLTKVFQQHNLKVTIELSTQKVDFLDITMDLEKDEYLPFRKENAKNIYMNFNSNHPYPIKKEIPSKVQKRLSSLSKTKEIFDKIKDRFSW